MPASTAPVLPVPARLALVVTIGVPGSGKSTLVASSPLPVVCPDEIRAELTGDVTDQSRNLEVFRLAFDRLRARLAAGSSVILDATNVDRSRRRDLLAIAAEAGAVPVAWRVTTPHAVARARNAARDRVVPAEVLDRMIAQFDGTCAPEDLVEEGWVVVDVDPAALGRPRPGSVPVGAPLPV